MALRNFWTAANGVLSRSAASYAREPGSLRSSGKRYLSLYEDLSLNVEPSIPEAPELALHLRGYDFVVLESFSKYVHNLLLKWNVDTEYYPVPSQSWSVKTFHPSSMLTDQQFDIVKYERAIKVDGITTTSYSLLLDIIQQQMPAGIELTIKEPNEAEDEVLYIPDKDLQELQGQLDVIAKEQEVKKKK